MARAQCGGIDPVQSRLVGNPEAEFLVLRLACVVVSIHHDNMSM